MKCFVAVLFLVACAVTSTESTDEPCPEVDIAYLGHRHKLTAQNNIESYDLCDKLCRENKNCYAWTWVPANYITTFIRKYCFLKKATFMEGRQVEKGLVSGKKFCSKPCPEVDIYYYGHTLRTERNIESYDICDKLCRENENCYAWVWVPADSPMIGIRKMCLLKSATFMEGRQVRPGLVSGKKFCSDEGGNNGGNNGGGNSGGGSGGNQDSICVADANMYRRRHPGTPMLTFDAALTKRAQAWADRLAHMDPMWPTRFHDYSHNLGENIYYTELSRKEEPPKGEACKKADKSWYSEIKYYDFGRGGFTSRWKNYNDALDRAWKKNQRMNEQKKIIEHFTQQVWKGTTKVGFGVAYDYSGGFYKTYVVANYAPAGNIQANCANCGYVANVLRPSRRDTKQEKVEEFHDDAEEKMPKDEEEIVDAGEKIIVEDMAKLTKIK